MIVAVARPGLEVAIRGAVEKVLTKSGDEAGYWGRPGC